MSPEPRHLLVEKRDGILTLVMNRPEARNALSPQMLVQLAGAWHEFRDSKDLRVAILTGAGETDFCAGGDLAIWLCARSRRACCARAAFPSTARSRSRTRCRRP